MVGASLLPRRQGRRGRTHVLPALALLLGSLALSACAPAGARWPAALSGAADTAPTAAGAPPPPAADTPAPASTAAAAPEPSAPVADAARAWGQQAAWRSVPIAMSADQVLIPVTVTPDARFLIGSLVPRQHWSAPGTLVLLDVETRQTTTIHRLDTPMTQVVGADADEDWVVWSEAAAQPNLNDWTLYAYHRATQALRPIAAAPVGEDGRPAVGPFLLPHVSRGSAVWSEPDPQSDPPRVRVKIADLATGAVTVLADNGLSPKIAWPQVAWIEQAAPAAGQTGAPRRSIVVYNLQTHAARRLKGPDMPMDFALAPDGLVWSSADGRVLTLTNLAETRQQVIAQADEGDVLQFPSMGDRLVAWVSYRRAQVWDRAQGRLITLAGDTNGGQLTELINGSAFGWATPTKRPADQIAGDKTRNLIGNEGVFSVINTDALPR